MITKRVKKISDPRNPINKALVDKTMSPYAITVRTLTASSCDTLGKLNFMVSYQKGSNKTIAQVIPVRGICVALFQKSPD